MANRMKVVKLLFIYVLCFFLQHQGRKKMQYVFFMIIKREREREREKHKMLLILASEYNFD